MNHAGIISRAESLRIVKNDLRKAALEKHAAELANATAEDREKLLAQINQEIEEELRRCLRRLEPHSQIKVSRRGNCFQSPNRPHLITLPPSSCQDRAGIEPGPLLKKERVGVRIHSGPRLFPACKISTVLP
jgi:hypothetical protein